MTEIRISALQWMQIYPLILGAAAANVENDCEILPVPN